MSGTVSAFFPVLLNLLETKKKICQVLTCWPCFFVRTMALDTEMLWRTTQAASVAGCVQTVVGHLHWSRPGTWLPSMKLMLSHWVAFGVRHILLHSPPSPALVLPTVNSPCSLLSLNIDLQQNVLTATMSKCLTEHLAFPAFTEVFEPFVFLMSVL